ncbi:MAG: PEP-CTERM sorting domain-containing protein [Microcystis novacekii Mn_MB_F_20050700_S1]|uniref:PEP-CTERM sorting domain-containing protein n=1 Tax=Microcystis novacekii Mn_MB_F_20050700_S1D TaxID=2486266 RepID=A0A552IFH7_9CHRO|nr:MAG: PEP-CTERM sorting domain-containing protein [Microcystis novacekii Mn_MB_F_20050700_S1D]TRU84294.1 MAG: PEP-CTERM sorting domain-containing protein [Microcystis novacekii Mn_MB_F_20050700_S1]
MPNLAVEFNLIEDIAGTPGGFLNQNNPLNIGDRFFAQVLMRDIHSNPIGLTGSAINLNFEANKIQNIDIPFNPVDNNSPLVTANFTLFRGGTLNNINGTITDLGGASFPAAGLGSILGLNQPEQFSLMHFQVIGKGSSNLILNVDLSQTNFADGTLAANDPTNLSQLIQIVPIVPANNPVTIPEPSLNIGLFILLGVIPVLKKQYAKRV